MPEDYLAVEHVKEARKRVKAEEKEAKKLSAPPKVEKATTKRKQYDAR